MYVKIYIDARGSKYAELGSFHTPATTTAFPPTNESSKELELKLMMGPNNSIGTFCAQKFSSYSDIISIEVYLA